VSGLDRDLEEKIRQIVLEVVSRYFSRRLLAVFTGGSIGRDEAVHQLEQVQQEHNLKIDLLFSRSGASVHDVAGLAAKFGGKVFIDGEERVTDWKQYSAVVFAVLTRTSAAKAAQLILDSHPVELLVDALMHGLPVVAVRDAADPRAEGWAKVGLDRANPALLEAFQRNLQLLESYGVQLCWASELATVIKKVLGACSQGRAPAPPPTPQRSVATTGLRLDKKLITTEDLLPYVGSKAEVIVPAESMITPLAADLIRQYQLKVVRR